MEQNNNSTNKAGRQTKKIIILSSIGLCLFISLCYFLRPDFFALITFFPAGFWIIPGAFLIIGGWVRQNKYIIIISIFLWILYTAIFVEEAQSIVRQVLPNRETNNFQTLRVISLNCGGGNIDSVKEIIQYKPDIVLLQESPSQKNLALIAKDICGENAQLIAGTDASIITKYEIRDFLTSRDITQIHIKLNPKTEIEVISTRLSPPLCCFNFLSLSCWKAHREDRKLRYREIQQIIDRIRPIPKTTPIIAGGDFNMPAGDAPLRSLKPRLHDAFKEAGKGWGNTVINNIPLARIDQIWISEHFRAIKVISKKAINSDHRMVICDVVIAN